MQKRRGPWIDVDMGGPVMRLLDLDVPTQPEVVFVFHGSGLFRFSFKERALRAAVDRLEAWDGKTVTDSANGTSRSVREFLLRARQALRRVEAKR